ncbi:polysaccharide deacetylase family protein [Paenibacillus sp. SEL3]
MNYLKYGRASCVLLLLISCVALNGCMKEQNSPATKTNHALSLQNEDKTISFSKKLDTLVKKLHIVNDENKDYDTRQNKLEEFTQEFNLLLIEPKSVEMKDGELVEKFDNNLTILTKPFQLKSGQLNVRVMNYRAPKTVTGTIGDKYTFIQWWSSKQLVHAQMIENGGPELTTDFVVRDSDQGIQLWLGGYVSIYHPDPVFVDLWELSGQKWTEKSINVGKMKLPDAWELNKDMNKPIILESRQHDSIGIEVLDHGDGFFINSDDSEQNLIIEFSKSGEVRIDSEYSTALNTHSERQSYELIQEEYSKNGIVIKYPQIIKLKDIAKQKSLNKILKADALEGLQNYADSNAGVHVEIDYEIKRESERFLSVQYTGIHYVKDAAYPTHMFYTTNLDMKQVSRIRLRDLVKVEKPFIELIKSGKITAVQPEQQGLIGDFTKDDLIQLLTNADVTKGSLAEVEMESFSYFTNDSLGMSVPMAHVVGDHAEYEIRFAQIPENIRQNEELWSELSSVEDQSVSTVSGEKLNTDQYEIEESQSFQTTFEGFGKVRFVSTYGYPEGFRKFFFFLLDDQGHILYPFPDFYGNREWVARYGGVEAVAFKDVNKDGLKDVIIIADVDNGIHGPGRVDEFPIADIYFQKKNKTFTTLSALDEALNDQGHNQTIKDVIQYVSKQRINVN